MRNCVGLLGFYFSLFVLLLSPVAGSGYVIGHAATCMIECVIKKSNMAGGSQDCEASLREATF